MKKGFLKCSVIYRTLLYLITAFTITSCREDISYFEGFQRIYFNKIEKDSTYYNFAYNRSVNSDRIAIKVTVSGNLYDYERTFTVKATQGTTQKEGVDFTIDNTSLKISPNSTSGTVWVVVNNKESLRNSTEIIRLELVENDNFKLMFNDKTYAKIYVSDELKKPKWWDDEQESEGLGLYSEIKYREFIRITGVHDFEELEYETTRNYILQFKYYLQEMKDAGTPVMDGNSEMTVAIYG